MTDLTSDRGHFRGKVSIFSFAYALFGIPSHVLFHRIGARKWLVWITVAWGIVALPTGFVWDKTSLNGARLLPGVAEAGFSPASSCISLIGIRRRRGRRPQDVARAVFRAATDPDCPMILPAGADAIAWSKGR